MDTPGNGKKTKAKETTTDPDNSKPNSSAKTVQIEQPSSYVILELNNLSYLSLNDCILEIDLSEAVKSVSKLSQDGKGAIINARLLRLKLGEAQTAENNSKDKEVQQKDVRTNLPIRNESFKFFIKIPRIGRMEETGLLLGGSEALWTSFKT